MCNIQLSLCLSPVLYPYVVLRQIELATGKFPYETWKTPFEQLKQVVEDDPPRLPPDNFTPEFADFITLS